MNVSTVLTQISSASQIPYSEYLSCGFACVMKLNDFSSFMYLFIAMTKAAMDNATMAMAVELAKHKVCLLENI